MLDLINALTVGGIFTAGAVFGRVTRRPKPPAPDLPVCSCGHGYGTHENIGCADTVKRKRWNSLGDPAGFEWVQCPCRVYDGPEPLPKIWTGDTNA